ncbi:substrate-binding periplasmic protein [Scleromatobacter humisilvae]|uniref:Transporter substrate-binding domain-containing protein n=1 Tax=Scleromatobacter humisilvae TaxID=2897159 RepID=A0A9X1YMZ2_9BURK|nr:transporter substrate-binding domain-containing protein [Scleromatobacter humisilvae]MCK9689264.1 transporter substrate-binding domain-containing protein [Scleromatobacter humisilvae]
MPLRAHPQSSLLRRGMRLRVAGLALALACAGAGARAAVPEAPPPQDSAAPAPPPALAAPAPSRGGARLPDCSRPLSLGLHEHGLLYTAQTGEGIDKDIAEEMTRRSHCHITLTVLPRARIWQLIETGALDFTLSGISNPQRDKFAAYAWYVSNKYYLLVRRDADVRSVADFHRRRALRLGLIRSFRYGDRANEFVDALESEERVTYAGSLEPLYTILLDDDIQAMIIEPFDFPVIAGAQLKAQTQILEFADAPVPHGLVMSRRSLAPAQIQAWGDIIQSMRADGTMLRIFAKYFPADLARQMTQF